MSNQTNRLVSLDVFRGLTVVGMVLVNNPGSWAHIYWPLEHAEWNGWTPTDLIFPFFLFIVGVAIPLGLGKRVERGDRFRDLFLKIVYRTVVIFLLGEFLAGFPYFHFSTIRIPGVLQRIAVCYFFASLAFLTTRGRYRVVETRWVSRRITRSAPLPYKQIYVLGTRALRPRTLAIIAVALVVVYWLLMKHVPVPGYYVGDLTKEGSLASYIDRRVFGPHIWKQGIVYDPEGLLSTMGALATTLFGVLTGHLVRCKDRTPIEKVAHMFIAGVCCVGVGWAWNAWFPINKSLWTGSYVFFTGGLALQFLALCYWLIDIKRCKLWTKPFVIFGVNAITLFVGTGVMARSLTLIKVPKGDGTTQALQSYIYNHAYASWLSPNNASLAFAISFILLWLFLLWLLYRKNIIIKI